MAEHETETYAQAEAFLNRTLAYQAAIAVHHVKEDYGLDVEQLHLTVAPADPSHPGVFHVTCTLHSVREEPLIQIQVRVDPRKDLPSTGSKSNGGSEATN
jgi:hypothetical protein